VHYYEQSDRTWLKTSWLGHRVLKCPFDLWTYQELIYRIKPDLIIETGTFEGASAYYFASLLDLIGHGEVLTVDVTEVQTRPQHPRITYIVGSSTADAIIDQIRIHSQTAATVMVILDSDHSAAHVRRELELYSPLVTPGSYLVVEDTIVNGHPVLPDFGPGPMEAVLDFLATDGSFEVDRDMERHFMSFNPNGWLRRRGAP
jgi:cephalosporin hydroxylase